MNSGAKLLITLTALMLTAGAANAADSENKFAVKGMGLAGCERFLKAAEARGPELNRFLGWMNGFLSGQNQWRSDTYDLVPWQAAEVLGGGLARYCTENPTERFYTAVNAMANALMPQRIEERSLPVEITNGDARVFVYGTVIERAKEQLIALGLFGGAIDETFDDPFSQALLEYQRQNGLGLTGVPDQATLLRLFY